MNYKNILIIALLLQSSVSMGMGDPYGILGNPSLPGTPAGLILSAGKFVVTSMMSHKTEIVCNTVNNSLGNVKLQLDNNQLVQDNSKLDAYNMALKTVILTQNKVVDDFRDSNIQLKNYLSESTEIIKNTCTALNNKSEILDKAMLELSILSKENSDLRNVKQAVDVLGLPAIIMLASLEESQGKKGYFSNRFSDISNNSIVKKRSSLELNRLKESV